MPSLPALITDLWTFLRGVPPQFITAGGTIIAATMGAFVVFFQIGRQARNAIRQNRNNEALKLKLEVYRNIIDISREASTAVGDLASLIHRFQLNLVFARQTQDELKGYTVPTNSGDPSLFIDSKSQMSSSAIKVMAMTETWQIIDPRIEVFRKAINAALFDIDSTYTPYFNAALWVMPIGVPKEPTEKETVVWTPPSKEALAQLGKLADEVMITLMTLQSYVFDFQREMQNLLLAELFDHTIPPRGPLDANSVVIRLDQHEKLVTYFDQKSNWGREQARINPALRNTTRYREGKMKG